MLNFRITLFINYDCSILSTFISSTLDLSKCDDLLFEKYVFLCATSVKFRYISSHNYLINFFELALTNDLFFYPFDT